LTRLMPVYEKKLPAEFSADLSKTLAWAHERIGYPTAGLMPVKTADGIFQAADVGEVMRQMERLSFRRGLRFADLGGGDGRVALIADYLGLHAVSFETNDELNRVAEAVERRLHAGPERVRKIRADFLCADLNAYDVLFYHDKGVHYEREDELYRKLSSVKAGTTLIVYRDRGDDEYKNMGFTETARMPGEALIRDRTLDTVTYRKD
jgi:hypothetical protein